MGLSFRASVAPDAQVNTADDHTGPDHRASAGNRARACTAIWVSAAADSIPPGHLGSRRWPHGSTKPLEAFPQAAPGHRCAYQARTKRVLQWPKRLRIHPRDPNPAENLARIGSVVLARAFKSPGKK